MMQGMREHMPLIKQELLRQRSERGSASRSVLSQQASAIDTREVVDWRASICCDWKVVTRSYTAACHEGLSTLMATAQGTEDPSTTATLIRPGEASVLVTVMVCRVAALCHLVNAGLGEVGSVCRRFEHRVKTRK